jgi:hypothetical protein
MCNLNPLKLRVPRLFIAGPLYPLAVLAAVLCGALALTAQTPATATSSTAKHASAHKHKRPVAAHVAPAAYKAASAPVTAHAPATPLWPANETPAQASVTWDSHGLRIEAANSSLQQILKDVSTVTGVRVEGLNADQRIFGAYGPGLARDVLSQLLQGSGYNVLMIGDQGQGAPRQIVLSSPHAGAATQAMSNDQANANAADDDVDTDEQPQAPPVRPGFAPGAPPRTPQQIMQEMQQRQQQLQQHPNAPQ